MVGEVIGCVGEREDEARVPKADYEQGHGDLAGGYGGQFSHRTRLLIEKFELRERRGSHDLLMQCGFVETMMKKRYWKPTVAKAKVKLQAVTAADSAVTGVPA